MYNLIFLSVLRNWLIKSCFLPANRVKKEAMSLKSPILSVEGNLLHDYGEKSTLYWLFSIYVCYWVFLK